MRSVGVAMAALTAGVLAAGPAPADESAGCRPPAYVVRALRGAERVQLVRLGAPGNCSRDPLARERDPACFAGYARAETFDLDPAGAGHVCGMLSLKHLGCLPEGPAGAPVCAVGFDVEGGAGAVRVLLQLPSGVLEFEIPNGQRFDSALSSAGLREWSQLLAAFGERTGRSPAEFEHDLGRDFSPPAPVPAEPATSSPLLKPVVPDVPADPITKVAPHYPDIAREAGVDGVVGLNVLVGLDGRPHDTRVLKSIPMLDREAVDAVMQWAFRPGTRGGKPVDSWVYVPVKFSLH